MNEEPKSFWTTPFGNWRLRLTWLAVVALLAGLIAADLAEEPLHIFLLAFLIAGALLFLTAAFRWISCWRNVKKILRPALTAVSSLLPASLVRWCGSRRNAKKILWGVAGLVALLALVRTEEDWRGKHAWQEFKREQEALGVHFDTASLAPPEVPDEQNFAMSPIVSTCYGLVLDNQGVIKGMKAPPNGQVNRMDMPADDVNPPKQSVGRWENGELSNLEILQKYYRDLADKTNLFPVPPEPRSAPEDVLMALGKYDESVEELRRASRRPYSRFPVEYAADNPGNIMLPHLGAGRKVVLLLRLRAIAELQAGQSDKALADVLLALRIGESFSTEPLLISQLVRIAVFNLALQPIYEGLAQHRWSDAQLLTLSAELGRPDFLTGYGLAMRGELAFATGAIEFLCRHREMEFSIDRFAKVSATQRNLSRVLQPDGYFCQNELTFARSNVRWSSSLIDAEQRLVFPTLASEKYLRKELGRFSPYGKFARLIVPLFGNTARKFASGASNADLARLAVGLERYRLAHGNYPDSLAPLAPQFIAEIPHDIINGQPLHYRREGNGRFILYSVGWNQTDDDGTVVLDKKGESVDKEKGDWVWRYPQGI